MFDYVMNAPRLVGYNMDTNSTSHTAFSKTAVFLKKINAVLLNKVNFVQLNRFNVEFYNIII